ncbi:hypothetical protein [Rhodopirellula sp. SWK7]|uniref:hypothetical protein n=1 Tax=Rhodopirellula sp. SWK7 TaxID=595460 RepID=UPI0002BF9202|nr:hypothetical protein [Rhodopirellula sp. SWK7]EMI44318.1 membrane protein [Rhodopirellula sp. SWK7]
MNIGIIEMLIVVFILIVLGCVLVGGVALLIAVGRRHGAAAALGMLMAVMVLPAILISFLAVALVQKVDATQDMPTVATARSQTSTTAPHHAVDAPAFTITASPESRPASWSTTELEDFRADLYPSMIETAGPLAHLVAEQITQNGLLPESDTDPADPLIINVRADQSFNEDRTAFRSTFAKSLEKRFPDARVLESDHDDAESILTPSANEQTIVVSLSALIRKINTSAAWNPRIPSESGHVDARIEGGNRSVETRVNFVAKPWVSHFEQIVSEFSIKQFVVGYSESLASTEAEARQSAMQNAQSQVQLTTFAKNSGIHTLINETNVIDRFAQKLSRPYGDVWREAVLIDLSQGTMQATAIGHAAAATSSSIMSRANTVIATLIILATIAICVCGNLLTQGYRRKTIS